MGGLQRLFDLGIAAIVGGGIIAALNSKNTVALMRAFSDLVTGSIRATNSAIR